MVELRARIRDLEGRNDHHEHLEQFKSCCRGAECENVFITTERMGYCEPFDVLRIIEQSLTLNCDQTWIILIEACEARPSRRRNVRANVRALHASSARYFDPDYAIYDRNQVRVCD